MIIMIYFRFLIAREQLQWESHVMRTKTNNTLCSISSDVCYSIRVKLFISKIIPDTDYFENMNNGEIMKLKPVIFSGTVVLALNPVSYGTGLIQLPSSGWAIVR